MGGIMNYAVEIGSVAMTWNISGLIRIGAGIQKLMRGGGRLHRHRDRMEIT
jgi:hypothetical protein